VPAATAPRFTVPSLLAGALDGSARPPEIDPVALGELLAWFREECAATVAGAPADVLPLRLPKARIAGLLACERGTLAGLGGSEMGEALVKGRLTDLLVAQHVTVGLGPDASADAVEADLRDALDALGPAAADVATWLEGADDDALARVWHHTGVVRSRLSDGWGPVEPAWWPRCQERAEVPLAGGALVLSATFDLVLGGPPTGRPWLLVEVKSGAAADRNRTDLLWYALVAALRHGQAPAWVATWTAADDGLVPGSVTLGAVESAARRGLAALERLVGLASGREPLVTPHPGCDWCPELDRCEPGLDRVAVAGWPTDARGDDG